MTRQEAIDFLSMGSRTGRLATASPTGEPHVAPVWFLVDGEDLVFTTGEKTVKGRNLAGSPPPSPESSWSARFARATTRTTRPARPAPPRAHRPHPRATRLSGEVPQPGFRCQSACGELE